MKVFTACLLTILTTIAGREQKPELNEEFLNGLIKFTGNVYNELRKQHNENFVVCPISVEILLSLIENGSEGVTSKEITEGLKLPNNRNINRDAFSYIASKLNVNDTYTLRSANKVYVKEGNALQESFKKLAVEVYKAEVQSINFNNKEAAVGKINQWVEEKTHDKIKNLVDNASINGGTNLILVNALYFHGNWVTKFNKENTKQETFYLDNERTTTVELMEIEHDYNYFESDQLNAQFLVLPYNGQDVTLTVVLPHDKNGLARLEDNINAVLSIRNYTKEIVHAKLPKFQIQTRIEYTDVLEKLGIVQAFGPNAEINKITGTNLKINEVVQKAVIDVEEEGTTAAAATATSFYYGPLPEPMEFIANHPFIFYLKYHSTVLFIGHYTGKI